MIEIKHLAFLARLKLSGKEKKLYSEQISEILDYFGKLDEVKMEGIKPEFQITGLENIIRADRVEKSELKREELLKNAPQRLGKYIKVPKVLE